MRRKGAEVRGSIRGCSGPVHISGESSVERSHRPLWPKAEWEAWGPVRSCRRKRKEGRKDGRKEGRKEGREREKSRLETILKISNIQIAINNKISTVKLRKIL